MIVDDRETVAQVTALSDAYEAALAANDLDRLDGFFWQADSALRYGVGEALYGIEAIRAFRARRTGGSPPRRVLRRRITCFGTAFAVVNLEFLRTGSTRTGRQSQTWVRLPDQGWRIVAAHVSLAAETS